MTRLFRPRPDRPVDWRPLVLTAALYAAFLVAVLWRALPHLQAMLEAPV